MTDCNCNCKYGEQAGSDFCEDGDCWLCDGCTCNCAQEPLERDEYLEEIGETEVINNHDVSEDNIGITKEGGMYKLTFLAGFSTIWQRDQSWDPEQQEYLMLEDAEFDMLRKAVEKITVEGKNGVLKQLPLDEFEEEMAQ